MADVAVAETQAPIYLTSLKVKNVLCLREIEITPQGKVTVLTGENGAGKSAVLACINMLFNGKKEMPDVPLRHGETEGWIEADLSSKETVRRDASSRGGTDVMVTRDDGVPVGRVQEYLSGISGGAIACNPIGLMNLAAKKQAEIFCDALGLDFAESNAKRQQIFAQRTAINTKLRDEAGALKNLPAIPPGTPDEEVSVTELVTRRDEAEDQARANVLTVENHAKAMAYRVECAAEVREAIRTLENAKVTEAEWLVEVQKIVDVDPGDIKEQIADAEETNRNVRAKLSREEMRNSVRALSEKADELTRLLKEIDDEQAAQMANADMPVADMRITSDGVFVGKTPLAQINESQRLSICTDILAARNSRLRVICIPDASKYDSATLLAVKAEAKRRGLQLFMEIADDRGLTAGIVMKDGEVDRVDTEDDVRRRIIAMAEEAKANERTEEGEVRDND